MVFLLVLQEFDNNYIYCFFSGQVRLIRDSGSGSVSVNIRSYNNGFSNDTDEDDDDFQSNEDRWRPPSPQGTQHIIHCSFLLSN